MKIAKVRGRGYRLIAFALAAGLVGSGHHAIAQDDAARKIQCAAGGAAGNGARP